MPKWFESAPFCNQNEMLEQKTLHLNSKLEAMSADFVKSHDEDWFFLLVLADVLIEILFLIVKFVLLQLIHQTSNGIVIVIDIFVDNLWRRSSWLVMIDQRDLALVMIFFLMFLVVAKTWMHKGLMTV